jgi:integration host factor subunit beta
MVRSELLEKLLQAHPHLPRHAVEPALDTMVCPLKSGPP